VAVLCEEILPILLDFFVGEFEFLDDFHVSVRELDRFIDLFDAGYADRYFTRGDYFGEYD
jgi:hypothetical protein